MKNIYVYQSLLIRKPFNAISTCASYRKVSSAISQIFSEFLFCNLFHEPLGKWYNLRKKDMFVILQKAVVW